MSSQRAHEGYIMVDHRGSPGISDDFIHKAQQIFPADTCLPLGMSAGRSLFEAPTVSCNHCQAMVIINPLRNRERGYCPGCDRYICDNCTERRRIDGKCKTFRQFADEITEAALKAESIKEI